MDMLGISNLLLTTKCWKTLIDLFVNFLGNYGWAIILFTVALKVVLFPLDFMQRRVSKKNAQMQAIVQPEIAAIQKKYPNDKDKVNQLTMEVYKKHNYNVVGSCVVLLVNIVITLVVFFTLFSSLTTISQNKMVSQYNRLQDVYETASVGEKEDAVLAEFEDIKEENGWLWITNVWKADTNTSVMMDFDDYVKQANIKFADEQEKQDAKTEYNNIEEIVYSDKDNQGWNGYFILIVLAGAVTFLSQYITNKSMGSPNKNEQNPAQSTNKVMMIVMPIIMIIFAWTSTSVFALYLITNSLMTCVTGLICNKLLKDKNFDKGNGAKKQKVQVMEYSRNYFKGE